MNKDKFKVYILEFLLFFFLLFALFESNIINRSILALVLFIHMFLCVFLLKKRNILPVYHKQVMIVMFVFSFIYLAVFYLMGLYFGYYNSSVQLTWWSFWNYILPLSVIIVSSEIIRRILLSQKGKKPKVLVFLIMVLIDLIIYTGVYDLTNLNDLLAVIGFILFASVACNLLYNYTSIRFGSKGIIIYRLVTVLYAYFIPIIPDVYIFFRSILRMIYPYLIYLVLDYTYAKRNLIVDYIDQRKKVISTTVLVIIATLISMLVSCQFKFGILVVGSGSMTGAINKGDATIYEKYDGQKINVGDVIIFKDGGLNIVHRVIDIKEINSQRRYYTKGDANQKMDDGYVVEKNIEGISKLRIKYIGYPSLWVRDIFS